MKKYSFLLPISLGLLLLGASCRPAATTNTNSSVNTNVADVKTYDLTYAGQDGKSALELLSQTHTTDATKEGFITAIDGRQAQDHEFWAFYVNDVLAETGAKDYITSASDRIGWRIETF